MERRNKSFRILDEDNYRLAAISEGLRVPQDDILEKILKGEYSSWNLDAIFQSETDPEEES